VLLTIDKHSPLVDIYFVNQHTNLTLILRIINRAEFHKITGFHQDTPLFLYALIITEVEGECNYFLNLFLISFAFFIAHSPKRKATMPHKIAVIIPVMT
jgi:hypothetical protein